MRILFTLLFTFIVMVAFCVLFPRVYYMRIISRARQQGVYPKRGKGTLDDVKRLLKEHQRFLAVSLYREIYKLSYKQAYAEVNLLERNLDKEPLDED